MLRGLPRGARALRATLVLRGTFYSTAATGSEVDEKRKVVERIRELYGIGFTLEDQRGRDALQNYQTQQAGSLKLLSKELYSVQTHFVLEYIQNADDNKYPQGVSAELLISYDGEKIDFRNNERGFDAKDVRALCAVGQSTKDIKGGYIGEKGIGFKAGFTVANRVQVHSNSFHFEFEEGTDIGALGFVVPKWVDERPPMAGYTTLIRLYLKPSIKREELLRQLQDTAQPELLLFLRQLRTLSLDVGGQRLTTVRQDSGKGEVTLRTQAVSDGSNEPRSSQVTYFIYSHRVEAPRHITRGRGSEATDITIAFPDAEIATQKVFAYLPVKEYGLKFLLNGDFCLASSREFITEDHEWNLFLRSHLAPAFTNAFLTYLKHSANSESYPYRHWEFVPLAGEVDGFFSQAVQQIWTTLQSSPALPSPSGGPMVAPCDMLFPPDEDLAALVTNEELQKATGKQFLAAHSISDRLKRVYTQLGVREFAVTDLYEVLKMDGYLATKAQDTKWFMRLYKFLAHYLRSSQDRAQMAELIKLPVVLLHSGKVISAASAPVYFFPHSQSYGFEQELVLVHRELGEDSTCVDVLENLGVQYTDRDMIIEKHILPQLSKGKYNLVHAYVAYLADFHSACKPKVWERIKATLKLRDKKRTLRSPQSLILPDSLNTIQTEELLGSRMQYLDDSFVNDAIQKVIASLSAMGANSTVEQDFIKETDWSQGSPGTVLQDVSKGIRTTDAKTPLQLEQEKWIEFFAKLGVSRLLPIERGDCPTFPVIVSSVRTAKDKQGLVNLLELCSKVWDSMAEHLTVGPDGRLSTFLSRLRTTAWVVTSRGEVVAPHSSRLWLREPAVVELFGEAVEYTVAQISVQCATTLGINAALTPAAVVAELPSLPSDPALLAKVYGYLFREFRTHAPAITLAFQTKPLTWAGGQMYKLSDVVWRDPTNLVTSKAALAPHYVSNPELHAFFVGDLRVPALPLATDYMNEISALAATGEANPSKATLLLEQLATMLADGDWTEQMHTAWNESLQQPLFLTRDGQWSKASDCFIDDDPAISAELETRGNVKFVNVPLESVPKLGPLLRISGVSRVSECLTQRRASGVEGAAPDPALTERLREIAKYLRRDMYSVHNRQYTTHREKLRRLLSVSVVRVDSLVMRRSACGVDWDTPQQCVLEGEILYMTRDCPEWSWQAALADYCGIDPLIVYGISAAPDREALFKGLHISHLPVSEQ